MSNKKLKKAPLQEVIFELKWELSLDDQGESYDKGFGKAFGLFSHELERDFPIQKPLFPPNSQAKVTGIPVYQFWKNELTWPVIQIGPGILTVNDVEGHYVWDDNYRPVVERAIRALIESYKNGLSINYLSLQYVDAVDVEEDVTEASKYIAKNFNTEVVNKYKTFGREAGISLTQMYLLEDGSLMSTQIQTAINNNNNKKSILWSTEVRKEDSVHENQVISWLDFAHKHCSENFVNMLAPDFYASFDE